MRSLDAPIHEVMVLEDRARILRRGSLQLEAGRVSVRVDGVAPVLSDRTLVVRALPGGGGVSVVEARVHRERVIKPGQRPQDLEALEKERRELQARIDMLAGSLAALNIERTAIQTLLALRLHEIALDVSRGRAARAVWVEDSDRLIGRERETCQAHVEPQLQKERLEIQLADLSRHIETLRSPATDQRCWLEIQLEVATKGDHRLEIEYTVPGACWRPYHVAHLAGDQMELASGACVWQDTGEDWSGVKIKFSTQRPALGASPPMLTSDELLAQPRQTRVVVKAREQRVTDTGLGAMRPDERIEVPGIDDGGDVLFLEGPASTDVPSNGRAYRVPLFAFKAKATLQWVLMPQRTPRVILKSVQGNESTRPILAGPVDLIRESGFVGRTSLLFIAPGERFALGWGPDPAISVHREEHEVEEDASLLTAMSAWTTRRYDVAIQISNMGDSARTLEIVERIPVSEIEKIQVVLDRDATTDKPAPDGDGMVRWSIALAGLGRRKIEMRYRIKTHRDVTTA